MPADVGSQSLTLKFGASGNSANVNRRFVGIRPTGIYSGGYLTVVNNTTTSISTFVCEVTDGTHQIRVETTAAVSLTVSSVIPYIVIRWSYTGNTLDYAELLAVGSGSLQANDLIIGKCTFTGGGLLNGAVYDERSNPDVKDLFLKVEATAASELRVRVKAGRIQTSSANIDIDDQKTSLFTPPVSNSRIDLVYIDRVAGTVAIDASGTAAATPTAPDYGGKLVLAEVTLASTSTNITAGMIKDVRDFTSSGGSGLKMRTGTLTNYDFTQADLTQDGAWHDLDLSSLIPVNSKEVTLAVGLLTTSRSPAELLSFRMKGNTDSYNIDNISNTQQNLGQYGKISVGVSADRKIQYRASYTVGAIDIIQIVVRSWTL